MSSSYGRFRSKVAPMQGVEFTNRVEPIPVWRRPQENDENHNSALKRAYNGIYVVLNKIYPCSAFRNTQHSEPARLTVRAKEPVNSTCVRGERSLFVQPTTTATLMAIVVYAFKAT